MPRRNRCVISAAYVRVVGLQDRSSSDHLLDAPHSIKGQIFGPLQESLEADWIRIRLGNSDCELHYKTSASSCESGLSFRCPKVIARFSHTCERPGCALGNGHR